MFRGLWRRVTRLDIPAAIAVGAVVLVFFYAVLSIKYACPPQNDQTKATAQCYSENDLGWWHSATAWTAIFTFTLTISTIGLWLVTDHAVQETRRIGEIQVRAYVSIKSAKFIFIGKDDPLPMVEATAINTGQSPARNFEWLPTIEYQTKAGAIIEPFSEEMFSGIGVDIGASREHEAKHFGTLPLVATVLRHMEMPDAVFVRVRIYYRWKDVFGEPFTDQQTFVGMAEKHPSDENMRKIHPLNDSQWACILEPVAGEGEHVILVKEKGKQKSG